jgi:hypothetical protein
MIRTQLGLRNLSDPNTHKEHFPFAVEAAFSGFELNFILNNRFTNTNFRQ